MDTDISPLAALEQRDKRVLALDSGGVRCLSSLLILQDIMRKLVPESTRTIDLPKPCDYFDLICGSGHGAILALMLGRLRMSVYECIDKFKALEIQSGLQFNVPGVSTDRAELLKTSLQQLLSIRDLNEEELLFERNPADSTSTRCRTFVLTMDLNKPGLAVRLRSYPSKVGGQPWRETCSLLQAAQAATATPLQSRQVDIGAMSCSSVSSFGFSNPSGEAFDEAAEIWSPRNIKIITSIGSGQIAQHIIPGKIEPRFWNIYKLMSVQSLVAHDFERVVSQSYRDAKLSGFVCVRLSVDDGLSGVERSHWSHSWFLKIKDATEIYLKKTEICSDVKGCAAHLRPGTEVSLPAHLDNPTLETRGTGGTGGTGLTTRTQEENQHLLSSQTEHRQLESPAVTSGARLQQPHRQNMLFDALLDGTDIASSTASDKWIDEYLFHAGKIFPCGIPDVVRPIRIAILDTGIDADHPFIKKNWKRPQFGRTRRDVLPDLGYADFLAESTIEGGPVDTFGHGTQVASLIMQLMPEAELCVARVFESGKFKGQDAKDAVSRVAKAIRHATDVWGVQLISMSFGFDQEDYEDLAKAISYANDKNVILLAAASNNGNRHVKRISYPASALGHVFCINAADAFGNKPDFNPPPSGSQYNFSILGYNVNAAWPSRLKDDHCIEFQGGVGKRFSGTSTATPIATGLAALVMQYGRVFCGMIKYHERLESFGGICRMFLKMAPEEVNGFKNIIPSALMSEEKIDIIAALISEKLRE